MSTVSANDPPRNDIESILARLRGELELLDKLECTLAAAHLSQAVEALELEGQ